MTDIDPDPQEAVVKCDECGATTWSMGQPTHCESPDCQNDDIEVIADQITLRAKWMWDDSENIEDMIEKTKEKVEHLDALKEDGWEINPETAPVNDDYAYLIRFRDGYSQAGL